MRFTFLVHPLTEMQLRILGARSLSLDILGARLGSLERVAFDPAFTHPITHFPQIVSATGATCTGQIVGLPTLPGPMLNDQVQAVAMMADAVARFGQGADLVGLGAICAIVGLRGQELASRLSTPVTTGNSLTCWTAVETTALLLDRLGASRHFNPRVLVVGLPGTMALGVLTIMARRGMPVEAFHPTFPRALARKLDQIEAECGRPLPRHTDLDAALKGKGIVVGAGSVGGELAEADLRSGTVVVDVARPLDTSVAQRRRDDLLIVEGEMISLPAATGQGWNSFWSRLYNLVVGQVDERVFACLAEPMVLCLEGRPESFSLGRDIDPEKVEVIGALAARHGFGIRELFRGREPLHDTLLREFIDIPWLP